MAGIGTPALGTTSGGGGGGDVNLTEVGGVAFSLGQQLAAASLPVVLTASQLSTLTPLSTVTANAGTNLNTSALALESGGNLASAVTALQLIDNAVSGAGFNITQQGGVAVSLNTGTRDAGTQRVTIATDDSVPVTNAGLTELAAAINVSSQMDVNIAASAATVAVSNAGLTALNGAISGTEVQVDVLTMPTTTVQATNLDIRDLSSASDTVTVHGDVGIIDQLDLTNSNPAVVAIVDADGTQITSFGGGTQYSDGDASADPTGTVAMGTDGSNVFAVHTDTSGDLQIDVLTLPALAAGTNGIGKLTANSGVDIGDVDVTSIAAGTNNIGQVSVAPQTANGLSVFAATSSDGSTALTSTAQVIKASAGQLYGWYIYNPNTSAQFVQLYNTAAASVTVGTTNPLFMLTIPSGGAANVEFTNGITFSNAGWSTAATSTAGGNGAPTTALDAVFFYK